MQAKKAIGVTLSNLNENQESYLKESYSNSRLNLDLGDDNWPLFWHENTRDCSRDVSDIWVVYSGILLFALWLNLRPIGWIIEKPDREKIQVKIFDDRKVRRAKMALKVQESASDHQSRTL